MHYGLDQIQEFYSEPKFKSLYLLKGKNFEPLMPGVFNDDYKNKEKIITALKIKFRENSNSMFE